MSTETTYGVLGTSQDIQREVINASLDDTAGDSTTYLVPWYGTKKISPGLEYVYDWMLDNGAKFQIIASDDGRELPNALSKAAVDVIMSSDVDKSIISDLKELKGSSALVMWDDANAERSLTIAALCISAGLRTLELTNGLVPIVVEDEDLDLGSKLPEKAKISLSVSSAKSNINLPDMDPRGFDRETLEVMPAASVKRMAKDAGFDVKTKEDAIEALQGNSPETDNDSDIGAILLVFNDGTELGFSLNVDLLRKIMNLVVDYQSK
jgi:hypothetical protein